MGIPTRTLLFFAFLVSFTTPGGAALLAVTDPTAPGGTDNVTVDTTTGLEWLDLTASLGISVDDIQLQFGSGGSHEGWRHATTAEVTTLFLSSAGLTLGTQAGVVDPLITQLAALIGVTQSGGALNAQASRGRYDDSATGSDGNLAGSAFVYWQQPSFTADSSTASILDDQPNINSVVTGSTGHFLVRATVPEPGASVLMVWVIACGALRRKRPAVRH